MDDDPLYNLQKIEVQGSVVAMVAQSKHGWEFMVVGLEMGGCCIESADEAYRIAIDRWYEKEFSR